MIVFIHIHQPLYYKMKKIHWLPSKDSKVVENYLKL